MFSWILGKVSAKTLLVVAASSLGINIVQFGWHQYTSNGAATKHTELAVSEALKTQALLQATESAELATFEIIRRDERIEALAQIAADEAARAERWESIGRTFKNKYLERCKDDEACESWSAADYRGDG